MATWKRRIFGPDRIRQDPNSPGDQVNAEITLDAGRVLADNTLYNGDYFLRKTACFAATTTTGSPVILVENLVEFLDEIDAGELPKYKILLHALPDSASDAAIADNEEFTTTNAGATANYALRVNSIGNIDRLDSSGNDMIILHATPSTDQITMDFVNWAATETHSANVYIEFWKADGVFESCTRSS